MQEDPSTMVMRCTRIDGPKETTLPAKYMVVGQAGIIARGDMFLPQATMRVMSLEATTDLIAPNEATAIAQETVITIVPTVRAIRT